MSRPSLDVGAIALGLSAVGFGVVCLFAPFATPLRWSERATWVPSLEAPELGSDDDDLDLDDPNDPEPDIIDTPPAEPLDTPDEPDDPPPLSDDREQLDDTRFLDDADPPYLDPEDDDPS